VTRSEEAVLAAIRALGDQASIPSICEKTELGRSTVHRAVAKFKANGQIELVSHGGGRGNTTIYRSSSTLKPYGLTPDAYQKMFTEQSGACAICLIPFLSDEVPHIDHCHDSGDVRGLLCRSCNNGLGHFKDNPEALANASQYLSRKPSQNRPKTISETLPKPSQNTPETVPETVPPRAPASNALDLKPKPSPLGPPVETVAANQIVAWFMEQMEASGVDVPRSVAGQIGRQAKKMLETGTSARSIAQGLRLMLNKGMVRPHLLSQFVLEAQLPMIPSPNPRAMRYGRGWTADQILANQGRPIVQ
jgi:hypothetical protein